MSSPELTGYNEAQDAVAFWTSVLGVNLGDRVAMFPAGGGQGASAKLVNLIISSAGLLALQVQMQLDGPIWTVPFQGVFMITKEPDMPTPNDMDPEALVAWSDQQGIPVPAEVREFVNNDGQEAISG